MGNMSHCRWENTGNDLEDCVEAFSDAIDDKDRKVLSPYEQSGLDKTYRLAQELVEMVESNHDVFAALMGEESDE